MWFSGFQTVFIQADQPDPVNLTTNVNHLQLVKAHKDHFCEVELPFTPSEQLQSSCIKQARHNLSRKKSEHILFPSA